MLVLEVLLVDPIFNFPIKFHSMIGRHASGTGKLCDAIYLFAARVVHILVDHYCQ